MKISVPGPDLAVCFLIKSFCGGYVVGTGRVRQPQVGTQSIEKIIDTSTVYGAGTRLIEGFLIETAGSAMHRRIYPGSQTSARAAALLS